MLNAKEIQEQEILAKRKQELATVDALSSLEECLKLA